RTNRVFFLRRLMRHQQQTIANSLHGRGNIIEIADIFAVVVQIQLQAQAIAQDFGGDVIDVVKSIIVVRLISTVIQCVQVSDHLAGTVGDGGEVIRGESVQLPFVAFNARLGGIGGG